MKINFYDKIVQIELTIEEFKRLSVVELKELSATSEKSTHKLIVDSSSKPTIPTVTLKQSLQIIKPKTDILKKLDNATIKLIREMALEGLDNKEIAIKLKALSNIIASPERINYWRKNTPKDYVEPIDG